MRIVKIIFKILLFPLWPFFIGWKVAGAIGFNIAMGSSSGESNADPFVGRLIGSVILAFFIYAGIYWVLANVCGIAFPKAADTATATPVEAPSVEVAK